MTQLNHFLPADEVLRAILSEEQLSAQEPTTTPARATPQQKLHQQQTRQVVAGALGWDVAAVAPQQTIDVVLAVVGLRHSQAQEAEAAARGNDGSLDQFQAAREVLRQLALSSDDGHRACTSRNPITPGPLPPQPQPTTLTSRPQGVPAETDVRGEDPLLSSLLSDTGDLHGTTTSTSRSSGHFTTTLTESTGNGGADATKALPPPGALHSPDTATTNAMSRSGTMAEDHPEDAALHLLLEVIHQHMAARIAFKRHLLQVLTSEG